MPNKPAADKRMFSVRITRELYRRLVKQARRKEVPLSALVRDALQNAAAGVELTPQDLAQIACETRAAQTKR